MELLSMTQRELTRLVALQRFEAGELTQAEIARQLQISVRQLKRLWRRYRLEGTSGVTSRRRGRPSNNPTDPELLTHALELYRNHYADFGPTFASEKLLERHDVRIDHEVLRRGLIAAQMWTPSKRKRKTHPPRDRRPAFGELCQIDGSPHDWFERRGPRCTLLVDVDDATSRLLALHFAPQETTEAYFVLARKHICAHGIPLAYYTDKSTVFYLSNPQDADHPTQFGRATSHFKKPNDSIRQRRLRNSSARSSPAVSTHNRERASITQRTHRRRTQRPRVTHSFARNKTFAAERR